jgi:hypothetical protein
MIKRITPIENIKDGENAVERLVDKMNEVILSFNELIHNLKPTVRFDNPVNRGVENEEISAEEIEKGRS